MDSIELFNSKDVPSHTMEYYSHSSHKQYDLTDLNSLQADWQKRPCLGYMMVNHQFRYEYLRIKDLGIGPNKSEEYLEDLSKEFSKIPAALPTLYKEGNFYIEIDKEKAPGHLLLGQVNFYRVIEENPNIPIVYSYLKKVAPELNFYQRLISSHIIKRPVGFVWGCHGGFSWSEFQHIEGLSLERLLEIWYKDRGKDFFDSFSTKHSFSYYGQIKEYPNLTISDPYMYYVRASQYQWLPEPWRKVTDYSGNIIPVPPAGLSWSNLTIKFLLDSNLKKANWVNYA